MSVATAKPPAPTAIRPFTIEIPDAEPVSYTHLTLPTNREV